MTDPVTQANNGAATTPVPAAPVTPIAEIVEKLSAQVKDLAEKYDARLGDMGKQFAKLKGSAQNGAAQTDNATTQQSQQTTSSQPALTVADIRAANAYDRLKEGLPTKQAAYLEQLEESGTSFKDLLNVVRGMRLDATSSESDGATPAVSKTKERPGTGPTRTAVQHPRTLGEYYALARSNPEQKKQLDKDPTFHPEDLPHRE